MHALTTHVWLTHACAAPQLPVASHLWTPLPVHCVLPCAQTPWHEALWLTMSSTHVELLHATGVPQLPPEHDWTALPEHWLVPALQAPVHTPPAHVPVVHGSPIPHWPFAPHVCTPPLASHWVALGVHAPQAPPEQTIVLHAIEAPQFPVASHVCSCVASAHCVLPGWQVPTQVPFTQACPEQGMPIVCQTPLGEHSCACWPLHRMDPGVHAMHFPALHIGVMPLQGPPMGCHLPVESQKLGWSPTHPVDPGWQGPASTGAPLLEPESER